MAKIIISVQPLPAAQVKENQELSQSISISFENDKDDLVVTQLLATMIKSEIANAISVANTKLVKQLNSSGMKIYSKMMRTHRELH
ncbi:hypothetical phage-related protein [Pectobacterium atrosepticum SCRI1043]|uniref:Hypothetical phage-related protein n=1 Tax=Pectobacterium atrosepticum (strain SCRI 1043 / ATCC BAA-672) TaxID=218491 RepID=Q6D0U7_PECAS|nr:phage-like protein [Pectobacterium atrosepticum]AIA72722.1 hypothetical protein EV46_19595 [Pectobacterium atrosepticum]AIK15705.1 putative phage-related protein [Pectobacterium atrosepticum]MCL6317824.1 hypothetical protein [Pectobacterium atrosepticum]MCL6322283.1 hypothetical protein [Pectobacterium atrosepticum]POW25425.1 phage-like protein [Pectobacterium atrosepticum]